MNPVIEQLKLHRSIRKYKPDALGDEHLQSILESAQKASTSSNMQANIKKSILRTPIRKGLKITTARSRNLC